MILTRIYGYTCLVLLAACVTLYGLWQHADNRRLELANEIGERAYRAQVEARRIEALKAAEIAAIAEKYEQDKRDAEAAQERLVSDLRAGTVRLQNRWRGCEATSAATAAELDAAARDREESAARIVRAARDADDWIKRLQEIVRQDRAE